MNKEQQIKEWFENNKRFLFTQASLRVFDLEEMNKIELYAALYSGYTCKELKAMYKLEHNLKY